MKPYGQQMKTLEIVTPPDWMITSLERSEAQIAAGQVVPAEPVLNRLRASIARMQSGEQQSMPIDPAKE